MDDRSKVSEFCVEALIGAGVEKAESTLLLTRKYELNVESGNISLVRTTDDVGLSLTGIKDQRRASTSVNKTDNGSIADSVAELTELIEAGEPDPAYEIASEQPPGVFRKGNEEPDKDLMYIRLKSFLEYCHSNYPTLILEQVIFDHTARKRWYSNSNGVKFHSVRGGYNFDVAFTSKNGTAVSSCNYMGVSMGDLSSELIDCDGVKRLIKQSTEQTVTENLQGNFVGDIVVTPECMGDFVSTITGYLTDYPMMTGTSIFKDALGEKVADERLSLHSMPVSDELAGGYFFTGDGFKAENSTIIDRGVLSSMLLSLYGSRKTGKKKADNSGSFFVIDPGDSSFADMVKSVKRGLLLCRFSGGNPSSNGDFSGVAKNSYYIENGEIKYPVSETMVAGNLKEMLKAVSGISKERVNNGTSVTPWIAFSGVTISGK